MAIERALISVYDKTGVAEFARDLASLKIEIVSTGGTARLLARRGNFRARCGGTDGLAGNAGRAREDSASESARRDFVSASKAEDQKETAEHSIVPIDLVVVNLYPFSATAAKQGVTPEELIENIDIGGPAMVRSAAKNFQSVGVVTDPGDYAVVLAEIREKRRIEPCRRGWCWRARLTHEQHGTTAKSPRNSSGLRTTPRL
jgi:phosphoribosylaminoimidazolecarboxamide formyltransferase/IMP cyclohydrolase